MFGLVVDSIYSFLEEKAIDYSSYLPTIHVSRHYSGFTVVRPLDYTANMYRGLPEHIFMDFRHDGYGVGCKGL